MKRIFWLFCLYPLVLSAQETDLFKRMLKETLKSVPALTSSQNFSDSLFSKKMIQLEATKKYIPHLGFNRDQNRLLLSSIEEYKSMKPAVSINLTTSFLNKEDDLPETTGGAIANVVLTPLGNIIMLNPVGLFNYLMQIGVLPDEPFVPKPSRKERMLKTITKDVYHIDDY